MAAPEVIAFDSSKQSTLKKAVKKIKNQLVSEDERKESESKYRRGIILISHLPHGFYENELKGFFQQFGNVTRLRLERSKKTGLPKGYAFVEFEFEEVAKIAAESMNNYLMFERLIKCKFLDDPTTAGKLFSGNFGKDSYPALLKRNKLKEKLSAPMNDEQVQKTCEARLTAIERRNNRLAELGIDYSFKLAPPLVKSKDVKKVKEVKKVDKSMSKFSQKVSGSGKKESLISPRKSPKADKTQPSPKTSVTPDLSKVFPKLTGSGKNENKLLLKSPKENPAKNKKETPHKIIATPDMPKLSPKLFRSGEGKKKASLNVSTTPDMPKLSPKMIGSGKGKKKALLNASTTPDMPKLSPKKLSSGKSESKQLQFKVLTPTEIKKGTSSKSTADKAEKTKFSPKNLRSGKKETQALKKSPSGTKQQAGPKIDTSKPEKPKFSPKLLRSKTRQSGLMVLPPPVQVSVLKRRKSTV